MWSIFRVAILATGQDVNSVKLNSNKKIVISALILASLRYFLVTPAISGWIVGNMCFPSKLLKLSQSLIFNNLILCNLGVITTFVSYPCIKKEVVPDFIST